MLEPLTRKLLPRSLDVIETEKKENKTNFRFATLIINSIHYIFIREFKGFNQEIFPRELFKVNAQPKQHELDL